MKLRFIFMFVSIALNVFFFVFCLVRDKNGGSLGVDYVERDRRYSVAIEEEEVFFVSRQSNGFSIVVDEKVGFDAYLTVARSGSSVYIHGFNSSEAVEIELSGEELFVEKRKVEKIVD